MSANALIALFSKAPKTPIDLPVSARWLGGLIALCHCPAGQTRRLSQVAQAPARIRSMQRAIISLIRKVILPLC